MIAPTPWKLSSRLNASLLALALGAACDDPGGPSSTQGGGPTAAQTGPDTGGDATTAGTGDDGETAGTGTTSGGDEPTTTNPTGGPNPGTDTAGTTTTTTTTGDPGGTDPGSTTDKPPPNDTGPAEDCPTFLDGVCDEVDIGNGTCAAYSDYWDCGYCPWQGDGECDEGTWCPDGTDPVDCAQQTPTCTLLEVNVIMACADLKQTLGTSFCLAIGVCSGELAVEHSISVECLECGQNVSIGACLDGPPGQANWYCQAG